MNLENRKHEGKTNSEGTYLTDTDSKPFHLTSPTFEFQPNSLRLFT